MVHVYDYVFCNLAEDPLFHDPDRFPIPQRVLQHLQRLDQASVGREFDLLYVIHEIEKDKVREGEPLDADTLVPPSPQTQRASRRLGTLGTGIWLGTTVPLLVGAGLGLTAVTAAAGFAAMAPLALDPLLLGAIVEPHRPVRACEPAVWFYLAHWYYDRAKEGES